jgi:16S rRNA G966 N2-methylase RsmD
MIHLRHGDFRNVMPSLEVNFFSLVLIDPPYARTWIPSLSPLAQESERVLKDSAFFVTYSGNAFLPEVTSSLSGNGLDYFWYGAVKHEIAGRQSRWNVVNCIKPLLIYNKPPKICSPETFVDLLTMGKMEKDYHWMQQSLDEARELIRTFTNPGDWVLDSCVGSGTALLAAYLEGRNAFGIDVDRKACRISWERLTDAGVKVKVAGFPELKLREPEGSSVLRRVA